MTTANHTTTPRPTLSERALRRQSPSPWIQLGVIAGPLFLCASLIQALLRPAFHLTRNAVSLLSLGDLGWIQDLNFAAAGVLSLAGAVGVRRVIGSSTGGTWIPRLLAIVGAGLAGASVFHPDPSGGFPLGTPAGASATSNWHGVLHMVCGSAAFVALIAACFVFARRLTRSGNRAAAICARVAGIVFVVALAFSGGHDGSAILFVGVSIGWLCVTACMAQVIRERRHRAGRAAA